MPSYRPLCFSIKVRHHDTWLVTSQRRLVYAARPLVTSSQWWPQHANGPGYLCNCLPLRLAGSCSSRLSREGGGGHLARRDDSGAEARAPGRRDAAAELTIRLLGTIRAGN
ncbi:hypothetical protein J6590_038690 [Homalodisca vitripennis]|nr:hypothetical protein J6590_038690 [Homalodisca vitripennis]